MWVVVEILVVAWVVVVVGAAGGVEDVDTNVGAAFDVMVEIARFPVVVIVVEVQNLFGLLPAVVAVFGLDMIALEIVVGGMAYVDVVGMLEWIDLDMLGAVAGSPDMIALCAGLVVMQHSPADIEMAAVQVALDVDFDVDFDVEVAVKVEFAMDIHVAVLL